MTWLAPADLHRSFNKITAWTEALLLSIDVEEISRDELRAVKMHSLRTVFGARHMELLFLHIRSRTLLVWLSHRRETRLVQGDDGNYFA
jgi:hypothetical protein